MSDLVQVVSIICSTLTTLLGMYLAYRIGVVERISRSNNAAISKVVKQTNGESQDRVHSSIMKAFGEGVASQTGVTHVTPAQPPSNPPA